MEFVKLLNAGRFHSSIYHRILNAIIHSAVDADMFLDILNSKYFKYIDVRYFTYISMEKFVKTLEASALSADKTVMENSETENESKDSLELSIRKIYQVLSRIPPPHKQAEKSDLEMWSGSDESSGEKPKDKKKKSKDQDSNLLSPTTIAKRMKLKFTKAWISFLRLPLPLDVYKEVLASIHQTVIPHLSNPAMLCDFLTKSYDIGGVVSVMALSSLFILMTEHGLEYPNFYEKLYALLVPSVFVAKHRARFLQLLDACLRSSLLPAYLAASFAKKLSRLSLSVPPSGSLVITALIYNLLRRHPTINHLVHQEPVDNANEANSEAEEDNESSRPKTNKKLGMDYFNNQETDLKKTGAMSKYLTLPLLDACLRSSLLPAYLAASFAKKLSRLSLSVPPSGSLVITALIYNLLRRHPTINHLVHQEPVDNANEANSEAEEDNESSRPKTNKKLGMDYFNNQETDLKKTGAMRSSLWEIDTLRHHYCPPVSRFVSSLETDLTIRAKTTEMKIEDFSSGSYATIFGDEIRRRVKQVPLAFYKAVPTSLFEDSDFPGWTFTIPQEEGKC
ncbi:hypothetical protein F2Q70_00000940 [Brassica cretica]|uniref:CCAAT-binding factor domain-containing protein n=1 Tax=Brassica cretica TaxID=69181 RepID=A0A8S9IQQ5_BRACR|nr:hypothetical protein F2Q70_00000940 [Brassica cretica]